MSDESVTLRHEGRAGLERLAAENEARTKADLEHYARSLANALGTLKAKGVKTFSGMLDHAPFTVEFFAPVPPVEPTPEKLPPATGEERCECACLLSDHEPGGGTCLHGCPAEKCGLPEGE